MTEVEKRALAHRYLYYVLCTPVISDYEYDMLERRALREVEEDSKLRSPGSDLPASYPDEVIELAEKIKLSYYE